MLGLGMAVALHHGAPAMGGEHHAMGSGDVAELCLAVFSAVGAAVMAVAVAFVGLRPWRAPLRLEPRSLVVAREPVPRARAGPAFLCVLRR